MSKNLASQRSQEYREKRRSRSRSKEGTKRRKYDEEPERSAEYKEKIGWNQSSSQQKTYGTHYPPVIHEKQRLDPTKPNPYNRCSNYEENKSSLNISALLPQKETKPMQANTAAGRSVQADTSFHSLLESLKGPLQQQPSSDATQDVSALLTALGALDAQSEGGPGGQQHQLPDRAAGNNVELLMKLLLEQKERQKQEHEKEAFLKLLLQVKNEVSFTYLTENICFRTPCKVD